MIWFLKNRKTASERADIKAAIVEVEESKAAFEVAFQEARQAGKDYNKLLIENGFTPKLYVATGGRLKKGTK